MRYIYRMKKRTFIYILFLLFTITLSSCKKDLDLVTDTQMRLSISGGVSLEVEGGDITKNIIVSCSSPAQEDIVVDLEISEEASVAELSTKQLIIKKGTKTVESGVTFMIAAFPNNAPEKTILINISTKSPNVSIETPSTEFTVKGFTPLTLKAEVNNTEFNTFDAGVELKITLTLSKKVDQELSFALIVGDNSSDNIKELITETPKIKIAADQTEGSATIGIKRGTVGLLKLEVVSDTEGLTVETIYFDINFFAEKEV